MPTANTYASLIHAKDVSPKVAKARQQWIDAIKAGGVTRAVLMQGCMAADNLPSPLNEHPLNLWDDSIWGYRYIEHMLKSEKPSIDEAYAERLRTWLKSLYYNTQGAVKRNQPFGNSGDGVLELIEKKAPIHCLGLLDKANQYMRSRGLADMVPCFVLWGGADYRYGGNIFFAQMDTRPSHISSSNRSHPRAYVSSHFGREL